MLRLMADADVEGHFQKIISVARGHYWNEMWRGLNVSVTSFAEQGLDRTISDQMLWRFTQANQIILVTGNRNHDTENSLEATILREGTLHSLPIITIADAGRIQEREYCDRAVEKLFEYLLDVDLVRGAGRIYIP